MLQTIVEREPADSPGPDIVEVLLTSLESQIARGRAEINYSCSNRDMVNCNLATPDFIKPTSTIQVTDTQIGPVFGVVDSFSLTFSVNGDSLSISSSLVYEKEVI